MSYITDNLELFSNFAELIANHFGSDCEVVIHDLTRDYDNTIVAIWNGHVTGRKVGGSGTNAGLEILRGTVEVKDSYNYLNTIKDGRIIRSSSKYFKDENGKVVGSICINIDITKMLDIQKYVNSFVEPDLKEHPKEIFTSNIDELFDSMMKDAVNNTGKKLEELNKEDKIEVVAYLDKKGAFLIKKSVERLADFLGISRFTIYNYLNAKNDEN